MIKLTLKGSFANSERFFANAKDSGSKFRRLLDQYGSAGVDALAAATPKDTGQTAKSWYYKSESYGLSFGNSNQSDGIPIVVLIEYGHGTRNGGYVPARDFINPAIQPIFDRIADAITKEVQSW